MSAVVQIPPVDPEFATWCRGTSVGEDRTRLERRWAGICSLTDTVGSADIEAMVRVVFRTKAPATTQQIARLREPFHRADELFELSGNDRELELLCAATLSHLSRSKTKYASRAALAVTTTAFSGVRKAELPIDLVGKCEQSLIDLAVDNRKRPEIRKPQAAPAVTFDSAIKKLQQQQDWSGVAAAFGLAAEATHAAVLAATKSSVAFNAAIKLIALQDEELQMLWWLVGERSHDLDCSFNSVPSNSRPLIFASELAEITGISPGPMSIKGLLQRAGVAASKKIGIVDSVNACDSKWLVRVVDGLDPSPASAPILFAIKRKLETNDEVSWIAGWAATTALKSDVALAGLPLANQFYRERLLARLS